MIILQIANQNTPKPLEMPATALEVIKSERTIKAKIKTLKAYFGTGKEAGKAVGIIVRFAGRI